MFQKCSQLIDLETFFFLKTASRDPHKPVRISEDRIVLTMRRCHIIPGMTSMYPPQDPDTPRDLPGFYFPFEAANLRLINDSSAELPVPFPIHGNREEHPCLEMSRILGNSPMAICCSALGWTLQETKLLLPRSLEAGERFNQLSSEEHDNNRAAGGY